MDPKLTPIRHQNSSPSATARLKQQRSNDLGYESLHSTPKMIASSAPFTTDGTTDEMAKAETPMLSRSSQPNISSVRTSLKTSNDNKETNNEKDDSLSVPRSSSPVVEREEWNQKLDFLLSIIGFAVDLSNVWRFPYLCYKNGGGVFLVPCLVMILFAALPLFFLELALGQFAKSGPVSVWNKICPALKGIGYCSLLISWYVSFYYNVIIAWATDYIIRTLISGEEMPWQHCKNSFNTPDCISMAEIRELNCRAGNASGLQTQNNVNACSKLLNRTSPTEEFFKRELLQIHEINGAQSIWKLRPEMMGCVIIVFCILYFSLFKGVKSSGKVVWVTATAPYVILTILLARGLFLPGALEGILYYINPQVDKLYDPLVWVDAAVQVFYSVGVGFGVHITYASFNKFDNNCLQDCLITASVNSLTSFYSGFVIFTYLGYMAYSMDRDIANVASEGYGLVFQVYPEAISTLPFAKFWSLLFFFMLLTLGIDSAMGGIEAVITGIMDEFNLKMKREYFTAIIIGTSFLGALINCTQMGAFTMVWFDTYSAGISLICAAMFEAFAIVFYGAERFSRDIESMLGFPPHYYFIVCWKYICPIILTTIMIMSVINSERITYYGYTYPIWSTVAGWLFTLSSMSAIPIYAIYYYFKQKFSSSKTSNHVTLNMSNLNEVKMPRDQADAFLKSKDSLNNVAYV